MPSRYAIICGNGRFPILALEAARRQEILKRVRMQRPYVCNVADVAGEEREPARGVDRFEDNLRSRAQLVVRGVQKAHQIVRLEVLDDLRSK